MTTVLIDHEYELVHDRLPIAEIGELGSDEYFVRGSTALYDAVGLTIEHVNLVHRYIRQEDRPAHTVLVVTTDGYENASRRFTKSQVSKLVADMRQKDWEFLFIGADLDADEMADHLDVDRKVVFEIDKTKEAITEMFFDLACSAEEAFTGETTMVNAFNGRREGTKSRSGRKRSGK